MLWVDGFALVRLPVQVNGQAWDHRHGFAEIDQCAFNLVFGIQVSYPSRNRQVPIEPRIHQHPAVDFHPELQVALKAWLRMTYWITTRPIRNQLYRPVSPAENAQRSSGCDGVSPMIVCLLDILELCFAQPDRHLRRYRAQQADGVKDVVRVPQELRAPGPQ